MNKRQIKKMTAKDWALKLGIQFVSFEGFPSKDSFNNDRIDRYTFLLCASNCVLTEPFQKSRREVSNFKQRLMNVK